MNWKRLKTLYKIIYGLICTQLRERKNPKVKHYFIIGSLILSLVFCLNLNILGIIITKLLGLKLNWWLFGGINLFVFIGNWRYFKNTRNKMEGNLLYMSMEKESRFFLKKNCKRLLALDLIVLLLVYLS